MMQQMMSNPQMMQTLLQSSYMQSAMQSMASNPEMARQVGVLCKGWYGGLVVGTSDLQLAVAGSIPGHDTARLYLG